MSTTDPTPDNPTSPPSTRIPPITPPNPPPHLATSPSFASALSATLARRRTQGGGLNALDQTLLHSPALTQGWNALLGAVRAGCCTALGDDLRELAICRVAVLNCARFEWAQHAGLLRAAWVRRVEARASLPGGGEKGRGTESVNEEAEAAAAVEAGSAADAVLDLVSHAPAHVFGPLAAHEAERLHWRARGRTAALDERAFAVLADADAMTRDVVVPDSIWQQLRDAFKFASGDEGGSGEQRLLVEITGAVAAYNCVSRFLVALDVAGMKEWDAGEYYDWHSARRLRVVILFLR